MDLQPYVDAVRRELHTAAAAGGQDAAELADRLSAPLESALRLALLEALSEAAELITRDLAPGSVDVRLRGRDPEFSVSLGVAPAASVTDPDTDDDGRTWRVTLRLPEHLRPRVDASARGEGLSINSWLARVVGSALGGTRTPSVESKNLSGWVR